MDIVKLLEELEAKGYIPKYYRGRWTFFGKNDAWHYIAIMDDKTCAVCKEHDGWDYSGTKLRRLFPWLSIDGVNLIHPHVHPNCRCLLIRFQDEPEPPVEPEPEQPTRKTPEPEPSPELPKEEPIDYGIAGPPTDEVEPTQPIANTPKDTKVVWVAGGITVAQALTRYG